jgi:hypothetical protein
MIAREGMVPTRDTFWKTDHHKFTRNQIGSGNDIPAPNLATELRRGLGVIRLRVWF